MAKLSSAVISSLPLSHRESTIAALCWYELKPGNRNLSLKSGMVTNIIIGVRVWVFCVRSFWLHIDKLIAPYYPTHAIITTGKTYLSNHQDESILQSTLAWTALVPLPTVVVWTESYNSLFYDLIHLYGIRNCEAHVAIKPVLFTIKRQTKRSFIVDFYNIHEREVFSNTFPSFLEELDVLV